MAIEKKRIILYGLIFIILSPVYSIAQEVPVPAAPSTPNEEHLAILNQGVGVWNKWRDENPNVRPELPTSDLLGKNLSGADMFDTNLSGADMFEADLSGADLSEANLSGADLRFSTLNGTIFEPKKVPRARDLVGAVGLREIKVLLEKGDDGSQAYDIGALVEVREDAKKVGLREMERDLTCAIERIRNSAPVRSPHARVFYCLAFDWTSAYGAEPHKPFIILFIVFLVGAILHGVLIAIPELGGGLFIDFRLKYEDNYGTLKVCQLEKRDERTLQSEDSKELQNSNNPPPQIAVKVPPSRYVIKRKGGKSEHWELVFANDWHLLRLAIYFSLLSTFNIGYKEFNVGSWLGRLQKRQYTLRARGWLRVVSGTQSLLGVYLLALWILCTFGRPFG